MNIQDIVLSVLKHKKTPLGRLEDMFREDNKVSESEPIYYMGREGLKLFERCLKDWYEDNYKL